MQAIQASSEVETVHTLRRKGTYRTSEMACGPSDRVNEFFPKVEDQPELGEFKVFQDPIHGSIQLHPLLVKIIDTPQFQRLRDIKQLGGVYCVYPGAAHNRFEHSIGVSYLAGELIENLQKKQPELNIVDEEILCVRIAGLCHDMGHGPFSHLFQDLFIPQQRKDRPKWTHEEGSRNLFKYMISANGLLDIFQQYNLTDDHVTFIQNLMSGTQPQNEQKPFLFEIVANKLNGIDVDKMDYIARDCHNLGIRLDFDWRRYFMFTRVIAVDGVQHICAREKTISELYELFKIRDILFRRAYQHKTKRAVEYMIRDALVYADDVVRLPDEDGKLTVRMSESIDKDKMYSFTHLTDSVLHWIMTYPAKNGEELHPDLQKSREIIEKVERRQLFPCIGRTVPRVQQPQTTLTLAANLMSPVEAIPHQICSTKVDGEGESSVVTLKEDDILVDVVYFDYGMGKDNPMDKVYYYKKNKQKKAVKINREQVSQMLPNIYREMECRIYLKKTNLRLPQNRHKLTLLCKKLKEWCRHYEYEMILGEEYKKHEEVEDQSLDPETSTDSCESEPTPTT